MALLLEIYSQTLWSAFGSTAAKATRAKKEVSLRVKWELNEKQAKCLKLGKTRVAKSRLVLILNLIG